MRTGVNWGQSRIFLAAESHVSQIRKNSTLTPINLAVRVAHPATPHYFLLQSFHCQYKYRECPCPEPVSGRFESRVIDRQRLSLQGAKEQSVGSMETTPGDNRNSQPGLSLELPAIAAVGVNRQSNRSNYATAFHDKVDR